jgi:hypothetical protein
MSDTLIGTSTSVADLDRRLREGDGLEGYGVRWDRLGRVWRVRNELTGQWALSRPGWARGLRDFEAANAVHRQHQPPSRGFGW